MPENSCSFGNCSLRESARNRSRRLGLHKLVYVHVLYDGEIAVCKRLQNDISKVCLPFALMISSH
jgi:hypothetical protein